MQNIQNSSTTPLYWGAEEGLSPTYSSPTPSPSHSNIKTLETKRSRVSRACKKTNWGMGRSRVVLNSRK